MNAPDEPSLSTRRLIAALLAGDSADVLLSAAQGPLTILQVPEEGAGIILVEREGAPLDELRLRLARVVEAQHTGVLHVVLVGGGDAERALLVEADRKAHDRNKLGVHQLTDAGLLQRVAGRRSAALDAAARRLPDAPALSREQLAQQAAQAWKEHEEAARFSTALAGRRSWATIGLTAACVLMYVAAYRLGGGEVPLANLQLGANIRQAVFGGEPWRLLASAFLHHDHLHLFVNMIGLVSFGGFLEKVIGWRRLLILFTASALGGALASALAERVASSVGASGALWGLMAAGLAIALRHRALMPQLMARRLRQSLITIFLVNGALSFLPMIDWRAHVGGGLVGFAITYFGWLTVGLADRSKGDGAAVRVVTAVCIALVAGSLAMGLWNGRAWTPAPSQRPYATAGSSRPVLSPSLSTGAFMRSHMDRNRLFSGVFGSTT